MVVDLSRILINERSRGFKTSRLLHVLQEQDTLPRDLYAYTYIHRTIYTYLP